MFLCMLKGGDWAPSQGAGWVLCDCTCSVTTLHSCKSVHVLLLSFFFFSKFLLLYGLTRGNVSTKCILKYRLVDCGRIHLNAHSLCVALKYNLAIKQSSALSNAAHTGFVGFPMSNYNPQKKDVYFKMN